MQIVETQANLSSRKHKKIKKSELCFVMEEAFGAVVFCSRCIYRERIHCSLCGQERNVCLETSRPMTVNGCYAVFEKNLKTRSFEN